MLIRDVIGGVDDFGKHRRLSNLGTAEAVLTAEHATGIEGASVVAERMRATVAAHTFPLAATGSITISLGIAVFPDDAGDAMGLIRASDLALYQAKRNGRNRVEIVQARAA